MPINQRLGCCKNINFANDLKLILSKLELITQNHGRKESYKEGCYRD